MGGQDGGNVLSSVERYDAAADVWTAVASMGRKRSSVGVAVVDGAKGSAQLQSSYEIEIAGQRVPAEVSLKPMYDPQAERVRV